MLGDLLVSADHVLQLVRADGTVMLSENVAQAANDLPELKTAYQAVVNAYSTYISSHAGNGEAHHLS